MIVQLPYPLRGAAQSFPPMILDNLKTAGVKQAHKEDRITFTALTLWPGDLVWAEGRCMEGDAEAWATLNSDVSRAFERPGSGGWR